MLTVNIICVGKIKEKYLRDACDEYQKRLGAFCKLVITEIDEHRLPENPSQALIEAGIAAEGKAIAAKTPQGSFVVAMCIEGDCLSSEVFASKIATTAIAGKSNIAFIIGSSFGLSPQLKQRANLRLSLSPMTFPHQLARVMLLEQIYRAQTITAGHKYHK